MKCPKGCISFVLSVTCTVIAGAVYPYSIWLIETPRKGEGGILSEIYGSGGLLLASILAFCGIVFSNISLRRLEKLQGSTAHLRRYSIATLILCGLLFLVSMAKFLEHEL